MKSLIFLTILFVCTIAGATSVEEVGIANLNQSRRGSVVNGGNCEMKVTFKNGFLIDHSSLAPDGYYISSDTLSMDEDGKIENDRLVITWPKDEFIFFFKKKSLRITRFLWPNENVDCVLED